MFMVEKLWPSLNFITYYVHYQHIANGQTVTSTALSAQLLGGSVSWHPPKTFVLYKLTWNAMHQWMGFRHLLLPVYGKLPLFTLYKTEIHMWYHLFMNSSDLISLQIELHILFYKKRVDCLILATTFNCFFKYLF